MRDRIRYWLIVRLLVLVGSLAKATGYGQGILMDAEGDSGYAKIRRPESQRRWEGYPSMAR